MNRIYLIFLLLFAYQTILAQCIGNQGEIRWRYWSDMPRADDSLEDLYRMERFPNGPDDVQKLNFINTPENYNDSYAALTKGYIRTEVGGQAILDILTSDIAEFYLSTDASPNNLRLMGAEETVMFQSDQYYYFEILHYEFGSRDYVTLEWKADFLPDGINAQDWTIVGGGYIYDTCDTPCSPSGTSCDDGNVATINDQEDGNCRCIGELVRPNDCIGERGDIQSYFYYNLPDENLEDFNTAISNNVGADSINLLNRDFYYSSSEPFGRPLPGYGSLTQAYISVPVSGNYSFNITGGSANVFYISSDETPANKTANEMRTYWVTGHFGHDAFDSRPIDQTVTDLYLEANKYYFIELRHIGTSNNRYANIFWKTPYQTTDKWVRIPTFYLFDYTCETSCIKEGIPCNDNNPYTANDQWDGNCNCLGTPCNGPADCDDPAVTYEPFEACETNKLLGNRADDGWLSCTPLTDSPNATRNGQHWIQYDFGEPYRLENTHIWNYNGQGATAAGFQQVVIDYSTDGSNWTQLGTYTWQQANGMVGYAGFEGPNFEEITARYVLISSMDDPNSCRGFGKIAFTGTPTTVSSGECQTIPIVLTVNDATTYKTTQTISSAAAILSTETIAYQAEIAITLTAGFYAEAGSSFLAAIAACQASAAKDTANVAAQRNRETILSVEQMDGPKLTVQPNPFSTQAKLNFYLPNNDQIFIGLYDSAGRLLKEILPSQKMEAGTHEHSLREDDLYGGLFYVILQTSEEKVVQKVVIVK